MFYWCAGGVPTLLNTAEFMHTELNQCISEIPIKTAQKRQNILVELQQKRHKSDWRS